ncbi:MAG: P-type conjugative transfer protein VirB9 [Telluria sp.]
MRTMTQFSPAIVAALLAFASTPAIAGKTPTSLMTDNRVKQVTYDPNQVYEIVGTYGYQTSIEFGSDEIVKVVTLGDSIAWQTVPYQNRLFIKPVEPNAATNLTVITDKRTYYFNLSSAKARASQTFRVRFLYPDAHLGFVAPKTAAASGSATSTFNVAALNLDYGIAGDRDAIALQRAFDDGQFTYFLFARNAAVPSFYTVGPDGTESLVNTRREGQYMVVERTASLFTLRDGRAHLCVRNKAQGRPVTGA